MTHDQPTIFETARTRVRAATVDDVEMYHALWTNPDVMTNMGFPNGVPISREGIAELIMGRGPTEFEKNLVVELKATGEAIGECKLARPDDEGIVEPDIKLLPEFWGHHYGAEVWRELVAYQFTHTDCDAVQTTPNVKNIPSMKMQEVLGGVRVGGEQVAEFPESMQDYTTPVHHYIYRVYREIWEAVQ